MFSRWALPLALLLATGAQASELALPEQRAGGLNDSCSIYMTEAECRAHQRILTLLSDPRERSAYLAMHSQLIQERAAACGAPTEPTSRNLAVLDIALRPVTSGPLSPSP